MTKYSFEIKLEAVLAYLEGKASLRDIANQFNVSLFANWGITFNTITTNGLRQN